MDSKEISSLCFSSDGSWANAWTFLWITGEPSGQSIEIIYYERNPRKQRGLTQIHLDTIVWRAQGTWEVLHIHATKRNIFVEEVWKYCQSWINKPPGLLILEEVPQIISWVDAPQISQPGNMAMPKMGFLKARAIAPRDPKSHWGRCQVLVLLRKSELPFLLMVFLERFYAVRSSDMFKSNLAGWSWLWCWKPRPNATPGDRKPRWKAAHWMLWQHRQALGSRSRPMSLGGTWPTFFQGIQEWKCLTNSPTAFV